MNCKHCQAELEDGVAVCPACGEINELPANEDTGNIQTAKNSPIKIALAVVAIVLVVAILGAIVVTGMQGFGDTDATEPTDTVTATVPADGNPDDVTCKGSYTVSDEEAIAAADTVVATMGDAALTNADLQIYYWMQVLTFLNEYSSYAAMFGLDYTQPLDTQMSMMDANQTWQQYFLACALDAWQTYDALAMQAAAKGFDSNEEYQTYAANVRSDVSASLAESGYADINEFLKGLVGPGSNEEAYFDYLTTYYLSYLYFSDIYYSLDPTYEEVEAYFDENVDVYTEQGIAKDESILVDVRHTLIVPEGGTTDESGVTTYSDEEWEACRVEAQALLDEWLAGEATEDTFAEMANAHSEDSGSNTAGGLYTYIAVGDMVQEFEDWCFDETRAAGDYGLVKTTHGYHIMYFVTSRPVWYAYAESDLINTLGNDIGPNAVAAYDVSIDYSAIVLGDVNLTGEEEPEEVVEEPEKDNTLVIILGAAVVILAGALVAVLLLQKPKKTAPAAEPEAQDEEETETQPEENPETTEE